MSPAAPRNVLVTGASGFIGRHCVAALQRRGGWHVHALRSHGSARSRDGGPPGAVQWHAVDLLDRAQARAVLEAVRPDALLHLGWHVAMNSLDNYRWVAASLELIMDFAACGGRRAVLAGSCAEYDWHTAQPLGEHARLAPGSHYGLCKKALGELVARYAPAVDVATAWARIFFVYGPHEGVNRLVPAVARALLQGKPASTTHGRQLRDYLYVEDLASALVRILESDLTGPVNVASGRPVTLNQLVAELAAQLGRADLLRPGALAAAPDEPAEITAEVSRLTIELGWSPAFTHEQGLSRTLDWWRQQGHLDT